MKEVCTICYEELVLPTKLPQCQHECCYSCIKAMVANRDINFMLDLEYYCPKCRAPFTKDVLFLPQQINIRRALPANYGQNVQNGQVPIEEDVKPDLETLLAAVPGRIPAIPGRNAKFMWLYESRTEGWWWRFDPRDEREIERQNNMGATEFIQETAGRQFKIDLELNLQSRIGDEAHPRKIWRVTDEQFNTLNIRGVAGIENPACWTVE